VHFSAIKGTAASINISGWDLKVEQILISSVASRQSCWFVGETGSTPLWVHLLSVILPFLGDLTFYLKVMDQELFLSAITWNVSENKRTGIAWNGPFARNTGCKEHIITRFLNNHLETKAGFHDVFGHGQWSKGCIKSGVKPIFWVKSYKTDPLTTSLGLTFIPGMNTAMWVEHTYCVRIRKLEYIQ
jgi:hypothetical protein